MTNIPVSQWPWRLRLMRRGLQAASLVPPLGVWLAIDVFSTPTRTELRSGRTKKVMAKATRGTVTAQGLTLATYAWGAADAPSVLLMHGWNGRAGSFRDFIAPLTAAGLRVVAVEAPAHGESEGTRSNLPLFIETVRVAFEQAGPFVGLAGHSLGGAAAMNAIAEHDTVDPQALVLLAAPRSVERSFANFVNLMGLPPVTLQRIFDRFVHIYGRGVESVTAEAVAPRLSVAPLIVHDRDDEEISYDDATAMHALFAGSHLHTTEGKGHQLILRDAGVVAATVAHLAAAAEGAPANPV